MACFCCFRCSARQHVLNEPHMTSRHSDFQPPDSSPSERARRLKSQLVGSTLFLLFAFSCTTEVGLRSDASRTSSAVIYGSDDRLEYYEYPTATFRRPAAESSAALVHESLIHLSGTGKVSLPEKSMGEVFGLCPDEPFWSQPAMAECSGTLVNDDLVLTAGHCLDRVSCAEWRFVFGFYYEASKRLPALTDSDVYHCRSVVAAEVSASDADFEVDYAWVRLDRPVAPPYRPALVLKDIVPIERGASVTVISYGEGLPVKIDSGGRVADERPWSLDHFITSNDNFHGSSGAGVYDSSGYLRGIVARGEHDYVVNIGPSETCLRRRTDADGWFEPSEDVTYVAAALKGLCAADKSRSELCEGVPVETDASGHEDTSVPPPDSRNASCTLTSGSSAQCPVVGIVALGIAIVAGVARIRLRASAS